MGWYRDVIGFTDKCSQSSHVSKTSESHHQYSDYIYIYIYIYFIIIFFHISILQSDFKSEIHLNVIVTTNSSILLEIGL